MCASGSIVSLVTSPSIECRAALSYSLELDDLGVLLLNESSEVKRVNDGFTDVFQHQWLIARARGEKHPREKVGV
jgi:hypothetical protein